MICYPDNVKKIAEILGSAGHKAYAVGGCIRDSVMGKTPSDWDMTTSASPDEMLSIFDAAGVRTVPTGLKHGTVTVILDGEPYECTSFRIDGSYTDSRHPDHVIFTRNVSEDLKRRDFTVNAMAGDPLGGSDGTIVDIFGGKRDIDNRLIRCVGDAETRFSEDALRILRAVRFATVLDFEIEKATKKAAEMLCERLAGVSIERRIAELKKILLSPYADRGIELLFEIGACAYIHESVRHPCVPLSSLPCDFACRFAALFGTDGAPSLTSLKLSRIEEKHIKLLCSPKLYCPDATEQNARYLLSVLDECAEGAALLRQNNELFEIIHSERAKNSCVKIADLDINGGDLLNAGIVARNIGAIMQELLEAVIFDPRLNRHNELMRRAIIINDKQKGR